MESPTLQERTEHGQVLELKGTDLQKIIRDQQTHYREVRAAEKEKQMEEMEFQLKRKELELKILKLAEAKGIAEAESKYRETLHKLEQKLNKIKNRHIKLCSARYLKCLYLMK